MEPQILASWLLVGTYVAAILALVIRGSRRNKDVADYAVGSIAFSPISVGLALAASTTSAATFIINPGLVAYFGVSGVFALAFVLPMSMFVSLIVMTKGFRKYGATVKALTLSQWVGERYASRPLALFFALLALLLVTFIVLILVGLTKVISASLGLAELPVLIALVVFSFGYMMFGGANSMVYTNTIQAVIMLVVAGILLASGHAWLEGGIGAFLERLRAIDPNLATIYNPDSPLFRDGFEAIFCTLVVGVAIVCQPHIITKSLLLKKERDVNIYLLAGILVQMVFFLVVIVGLYARLELPDLSLDGQTVPPDGIVSGYLVTRFPWYVGVLVFLGLIAAGMSTLEGLIQSMSITVTNDLIDPVYRRATGGELPGTTLLILNRFVIAALALVSFALAYGQLVSPDLSVAIFAQAGVYAYFAAAFVPVLFGTFVPRATALAAGGGALSAALVHFLLIYEGQRFLPYYRDVSVRNPAIAAALAVLTAVAVGSILHLATRRR